MEAVKKGNSFVGYLRALNRGVSQTKGVQAETVFAFIAFFILASAISCMTGEGDSSVTLFFGIDFSTAIFGACLFMGIIRRRKPSVLALVPITYKKRTLYNYLSAVILAVLLLVTLFLVALVMAAFILVLGLLFGADIGVDFSAEDTTVYPVPSGVFFFVFLAVLCFGAGVIISYIQGKKTRIAAMLGFAVFMRILALTIVNIIVNENYIVHSCQVDVFFEELPAYGVWLAVTGVIAFIVFACSVYVALVSEKPARY